MRYPLIALLACLTSTLPAQLTIADGGTVTVSPRSVPTDQLVVTGNTVVDAGGTLDLRGLFVGYGDLDLRGILVVTVTGPDRDSQYGNLFMDGMTTLGGSLRISLAPTYAPTGTVEYTLVNALPVRDSFARVVLPGPNWQLRYEPEKVVLRLDKLTPNFDLLSFTGESAGRFIDLRWQTASERASDYFIVEQFIGGSFQEVGRVAAAGDVGDDLYLYLYPYGPRVPTPPSFTGYAWWQPTARLHNRASCVSIGGRSGRRTYCWSAAALP